MMTGRGCLSLGKLKMDPKNARAGGAGPGTPTAGAAHAHTHVDLQRLHERLTTVAGQPLARSQGLLPSTSIGISSLVLAGTTLILLWMAPKKLGRLIFTPSMRNAPASDLQLACPLEEQVDQSLALLKEAGTSSALDLVSPRD